MPRSWDACAARISPAARNARAACRVVSSAIRRPLLRGLEAPLVEIQPENDTMTMRKTDAQMATAVTVFGKD